MLRIRIDDIFCQNIFVYQISDVEKEGSMGIILEGRVDIDENGQEIQPRHYISTVVSDGPVGRQGLLAPGDELLEVI